MKTLAILNRRQTTLETLRSSGALFHWHPLLVDAALDQRAAYHDLALLIEDADFLDAVERASRLCPSLGRLLGDDIGASLRNGALAKEKPFLHTMRREALARLNLAVDRNRLMADEIDERARMEYLRMTARYLPGRIQPNGTIHTFGFKAFFERQFPYKMRDIIRQCMSAFERSDEVEDLEQRVSVPATAMLSDTAVEILRAVRAAARSTRETEILKAFLAGSGAMAELAESEGSSTTRIRRDIETLFARASIELVREGKSVGTPRLLACRNALQDMSVGQPPRAESRPELPPTLHAWR